MQQFTTPKRERKEVPFQLDDHTYTFRPGKMAGMLLDMVDADTSGPAANIVYTKAMLDWVSEGLSEEDNARLIARLRDPDDDLDFDALEPVLSFLVEQGTDRPT